VLQTLHVLIHAAQLHVHYLDPLGLLSAYVAAVGGGRGTGGREEGVGSGAPGCACAAGACCRQHHARA
jgi:hypothetical protein